MSYTVIISADIETSNSLNNVKSSVKLPQTSFGTTAAPVYPLFITSLVGAGTTESFDLTSFATTGLKALLVKTSRPVKITLYSGLVAYTQPFTTYYLILLDTKETVVNVIDRVEIEVPAAQVTPPSILPQAYPKCFVEIFGVTNA